MKKEFGKWLMDIVKYILTAVILALFFEDMSEKKNCVYLGWNYCCIGGNCWFVFSKRNIGKKERKEIRWTV